MYNFNRTEELLKFYYEIKNKFILYAESTIYYYNFRKFEKY